MFKKSISHSPKHYLSIYTFLSIFYAKIKDEIIKTQIEEVEEFKWFKPNEIEEIENVFDSIKALVKIISK